MIRTVEQPEDIPSRLEKLFDEVNEVQTLYTEVDHERKAFDRVFGRPDIQGKLRDMGLEQKPWSDAARRSLLEGAEREAFDALLEKEKEARGRYAKLLDAYLKLDAEHPDLFAWQAREGKTGPDKGDFGQFFHGEYFVDLCEAPDSSYSLRLTVHEAPATGYTAHSSGKRTMEYSLAIVGHRETARKGLLTEAKAVESLSDLGDKIGAARNLESGEIVPGRMDSPLDEAVYLPEDAANMRERMVALGDRLAAGE